MRPQASITRIQKDPAPPVPIGVLRSALFSVSIPVKAAGKASQYLNDHDVPMDGVALGASLKYTGPRLTQRHSLVWQAVICAAKAAGAEDGSRFSFPAGQLLTLIGSEVDDQHQRERLWQHLKDLTKAHVAYSSRHIEYAGSLLASVVREKKRSKDDKEYAGWLAITLNKDFAESFLSNEVLTNDLRRKARLSKNYLACWLHDYIATHKTPPPKSIARIRRECGSEIKQLPLFRFRVKEAMGRLTQGPDALVDRWFIDQEDRPVVAKCATKVKLLPKSVLQKQDAAATSEVAGSSARPPAGGPSKKKSPDPQAAQRLRTGGLNL